MSYKLDPRILSKLRAFAERRRKLILIRGAATALAMLLATMLVVAAVDYFFVLPDEVRWGLSAAAYLAVVIAEWRTCLRLLAHAPGPKRLARLVEHAEPKLREDLLSAVELGSTGDERIFDSPLFRELLQQDVASRMDTMEVEQLLPVNLVRRYLFVAGGIVAAVVALFIFTGFSLGTLMLRAFIPGANLGRVSKTQVEVVSPNPAETLVPFGDAMPLLVKISGMPVREAWMETFTEHEGRQKVKLTAVGKDQFSGAIQVGREALRYRVRAGDAITKKYLLDAQPRPYVVKFTKTFHAPAYTKAAERTVTEESGDLIALEGTNVDLALETNQPIKVAELRLEQGTKGGTTTPLVLGKDGKLAGKIELKTSGTYRVHLVGASTGFENKFSPEYEIRAEPDLVPKVEITQPKSDLILPANDLVDLAGEASDDIGLARVEQHTRVNEGEWKKVKLVGESGLKASVSRRWDLFEQGAKAGDLITTKLVAFDLKGNRGESRPVQITVTTAGVEMKRIESLDALVALHESLKLWRQALEATAKATGETRQRFEQTGESDPQRAAAIAGFTSADAEFERQHGETVTALATALRTAQPGHQSADLVALGRQLAKVEGSTVRSAKLSAAVVSANPASPFVRDMMRDADDSMNRAMQRARVIEEGFRILLNSEEADLLAENTQIISREQRRLADLARASGDDAARWAALGSRVRVVLSETKSLEDILGRLSERGLGGERAKNLARELQKQREAVNKAMTDRGMTRELLAPTVNLAEAVTRAEKSALELRAELERRPLQVVKEMRTEAQPTWTTFSRLLGELDRLASNKVLPPERLSVLQNGRWDSSRDALKTHGDLEEIRPTSDTSFVSDLRATTTAIEGLRVLVGSNGLAATRERITALDRAFRLLEGAHDLQEILDGLNGLAVGERWQIATPRARTAPPRDWGWIETRLRDEPGELVKLDLREQPVREAITGAQRILAGTQSLPAFRDLDREMNERRKPDHVAASAREQAEMLAAEVKRALDLLHPHVEAAREQLKQIAPKLNEFAKALTKKAEELKQESKQQQEKTKDKSAEQAKADAEKALAQQQQLNEKVEALKDLLRADANKQDVLQADQRERARDADDALAMLKEPPPKASDALKDAAEAQTKSAQADALAQAAEQQEKLEKALDQISKHYEAMEQGKDAKETRTAMRAKEQELGVKQELDEQFAKAERMAQLAKSSPQEMLKQLEQALPINPLMQQELSSISQSTLTEAHRKLEAASKAEQRVAQAVSQLAQQENAAAQAQSAPKPPADPLAQQQPQSAQPNAAQPKPAEANAANQPTPNSPQPQPNQPQAPPPNPQLAMAAKQQEPIKETAAEAGSDVARAGRHEERLQNKPAGEQLQQLGKQIAETAATKVPAAQQALSEAQRAAQAQQPVTAANQELTNEAAQLSRMARGEETMPPVPDLPQPPGQMSVAQQLAAQQMAQGKPQAQAGSPQQAQAQAGQPAAAQAKQPSAPSGQPAQPGQPMAQNSQPPAGQPQSNQVPPGEPPASPSMTVMATPPEQTWMARTLDALDAALNAPAGSQNEKGEQQQQQGAQQGKQQAQQGQQQQGKQQQGQQQQAQNGQQAQGMQQAQNAMQQAQQAAQNAMRQARSQNVAPTPQGMTPPTTDQQSKSQQGALAQMDGKAHGALPDAKGLKAGEWGKLPKQMAEQLTRGQGEAVAPEYRGQVETYYRAIAERAKKP